MTFDPQRAWRLHDRVALRREPFGALAYHYDNRRLNLVRSPELVEVLEILEDHRDVSRALDAVGIDGARREVFERSLAALAASSVIVAVEETT